MASRHTFYFAYGTNMNAEKMNICQIEYSGRQSGKLNGYEFVFDQKRLNGTVGANIRMKKKSTVHGVLYTCSTDSLDKLDRYEGNSYSRQIVEILTKSGDWVDAHTYIGYEEPSDDTTKTISKDYLEHILCGRDLLPEHYLAFLKTFQQYAVNSCPGEDYFLTEAANETEE